MVQPFFIPVSLQVESKKFSTWFDPEKHLAVNCGSAESIKKSFLDFFFIHVFQIWNFYSAGCDWSEWVNFLDQNFFSFRGQFHFNNHAFVEGSQSLLNKLNCTL